MCEKNSQKKKSENCVLQNIIRVVGKTSWKKWEIGKFLVGNSNLECLIEKDEVGKIGLKLESDWWSWKVFN